MKENIPYKRPLVIGTGGGNDIVSACLIVADLKNKGIAADVAGVCSPGAWHVYNEDSLDAEDSINLVTPSARRFIPTKSSINLSFIDAEIPNLLRREGLASDVYNLSCRHGTSELISGLNYLISQKGYDGIIAVDVGGDILARGKKDPTILSPLMDFTTLYCLSQINIPSVLIEFGLQTDGELRPRGCAEILDDARTHGIMLAEDEIKLNDEPVQTFKRIYEGVNHIRRGNTAVMTLKTLESKEDLHEDYRFRIRVLDKPATYGFPITLESKYFGKVFLMDLKKLAETRELAFPYRNTLELFLKTKQVVDTKTEMDLLYNRDSGVCLWLAMTGPQIQGEQREDLLNYGLDNLAQQADAALLWKEDAENKKIRRLRYASDVDNFVITGLEKNKIEKVEQEIRRLKHD